jgi:ABC-2 type transport system permease protein
MVYGSIVMRSVIEEKTTRIVEVIISSVKPFQLMMGKVLGTGAAGLLQFLIWGALLMLLYMIAMPMMGIDTSAVNTPQMEATREALKETVTADKIAQVVEIIRNLPVGTLIISFVLYFFGGYLLYSSLYAAVGAAVDNETDSQQFMMPIMIPLMLAIYIGFAVAADDPHGTIATVFSFIPFTSPIVMMMRIPLGAPAWQVILSLLILYITFVGVIWLAGKIYRVGILSYGKKPTYKDLYKWLKYS